VTPSDGLLLVDKPSGPTSHDVIDGVRRACGLRRVGHAGTLDPFASGLLLVLLGRATRLAQFLVGLTKRYQGTIQLGVVTDTHDRTGAVTAAAPGAEQIPDAEIRRAMASLTGVQRQRPPAYSAKKLAGRRAYRMARRGETVDLPAIDVEVGRFALTARDGAKLHFEALVSSGTYVRALARDLGERVGCGAHLSELRRTAVGSFEVRDAVPLVQIDQSRSRVQSLLSAVAHLERRLLSDDERTAVGHGRAIPAGTTAAAPVALVHDDRLIAVAEPSDDVLRPRVVLVDG
jgi:tRNA pseudouridine55 synthase